MSALGLHLARRFQLTTSPQIPEGILNHRGVNELVITLFALGKPFSAAPPGIGLIGHRLQILKVRRSPASNWCRWLRSLRARS